MVNEIGTENMSRDNFPHTTPGELIEKVERCVHSTTPNTFSKEEMADVQAMISAWRAWAAMGRGFKWIVTSLGLVSALLVSIAVIWATVTGKKP